MVVLKNLSQKKRQLSHIFDMSMSFYILKSKLKRFMWEHFLANLMPTITALYTTSVLVLDRNPLHLI